MYSVLYKYIDFCTVNLKTKTKNKKQILDLSLFKQIRVKLLTPVS